jgi:tRNA A-37 threonylcarbamoyl transferase component Bud32
MSNDRVPNSRPPGAGGTPSRGGLATAGPDDSSAAPVPPPARPVPRPAAASPAPADPAQAGPTAAGQPSPPRGPSVHDTQRLSAGAQPAGARPAGGGTVTPSWLGKRVGRFRLLGLLGEGAMGRVFRAEDALLQRHVALKVLAKGGRRGSPDAAAAVERLIREARAAASLEHPHVVHVLEVNEANGIHYIAMELLEGGSLRDLVKANGPLDMARGCQLAAEAAEALAYAHQMGVVHRDVKPANLLLTRGGRCKVADFGLARVEDPNDLTRLLAESVGTPLFVAPEILRGAPASARSDIYSLGATVYYLLAGRPPYEAPTAEALFERHLSAPIPDLMHERPETPERLARAVARALAKTPGDRFESADEFAKVLRVHTVPLPGYAAGGGFPAGPGFAAGAEFVGGSGSRLPGGTAGGVGLSGGVGSSGRVGSSGVAANASGPLAFSGPLGQSGPAAASGGLAQSGGVAAPGSVDVPRPAGAPSAGVAARPAAKRRFLVAAAAALAVAAGVVAVLVSRGGGGSPGAGVGGPTQTPPPAGPPPVVPPPPVEGPGPVTPPAPAGPVDLLAFAADPRAVAVKGKWRWDGGDLVVDVGRPATLVFPYVPNGDYDYTVEFTPTDAVTLLASTGNTAFGWAMGAGDKCGFQEFDGKSVYESPRSVISPCRPGMRHVGLVRVRKGSVTGLVDNRVVSRLTAADFKVLTRHPLYKTADDHKLGFGTLGAGTRIHAARVTEVRSPAGG